jgi:integrase/recombinase XerD
MKLHDTITAYLSFKYALGMRMESEAKLLRSFCRTMGDGNIDDVTSDAVLTFIAGTGPVTRTWKQKASVLRSFYRYAVGRGFTTTTPLPAVSPQFPPTRTPYIYSTDEIKRLLAATRILHTPRCPLRALGVHTLLLLLYSTGLRISEALSLTLEDVDLLNGVITVRDTKFFKTRLVPTGTKLTGELAGYAQRRCLEIPMPAGRESAFLAITRSGMCASVVLIQALFGRVRSEAGLQRDDDTQSQPRLHDLRHTMVQHHLLAWYRSGCDVQRLLPQLATYLGHVDISSTQHYLTMTPELLQEANQRFERYAQPEQYDA